MQNLEKRQISKSVYPRTLVSAVPISLLILLISLPVLGQQFDAGHRAATVDGTPGLFKTWDAEPIRQGEVFFSTGVLQIHRDPGELSITTAPNGLAIGIFERVEIFGTWEIQKRVQADGIQIYRVRPGQVSRPSTTKLGQQLFTNAAPYIDVPLATGRGDLFGNVKVNLLSEFAGQPLAVSVAGIGKIPGHKTFTGINRGLSTGDVEVGFAALASKRAGNLAQFHFNVLVFFAGDPTIDGQAVSDVHHHVLTRGGAAFRISSALHAIAEVERYDYWGFPITGLNPTNPVDIFVGIRAFPNRFVSFGGGYVASVNHIGEDPARAILAARTSGFVAQLGLAFRR